MESTNGSVTVDVDEEIEEIERDKDLIKVPSPIKDRDGVPVVAVGPHDARVKAKGGG